MIKKHISLLLLAAFFSAGIGQAADYSSEVMTLKGTAQVTHLGSSDKVSLKEGDLLSEGDLIEVGPQSYLDVAYDKEWNNLTRLGENSITKIEALFPTGLMLDRGELFAKLSRLPKGTTFEVRTPSAVAAARGTEFLVSVDGSGLTSVMGVENKVEVFNLDAQGNLGQGVVLENAQKTEITAPGEPPSLPEKVMGDDWKRVEGMSGNVHQMTDDATAAGRIGQVQSVGTVEAMHTLSDLYMERMPKPADSTGAMTQPMSPEQLKALRDQFVEMGGDPEQFDSFKSEFSTVDTQTFDTRYTQYQTGEYVPTAGTTSLPPPPTDTSTNTYVPPPTGTYVPPPDSGSTTNTYTPPPTGTYQPPPPPPDGGSTYVPPAPPPYEPPPPPPIPEYIPPPPPPPDPCAIDPLHCGSTAP